MTIGAPGQAERPAAEAAAVVPARRLFAAFLRLGLTAFGGPAMVAYIRQLAVVRKAWLAEADFKAGVALCQSIPGATAMQTAAYVGLRAGGPAGALAAFVGFGLPAFALMLGLSAAYAGSHNVWPVVATFRGLQLIVVALAANATVNFARGSIRDWRDVLLAGGAAAFLVLGGSPILAIVAAAGLGLVLYRAAGPPDGGPAVQPAAGGRRALRAAAIAGLLAAAMLAGLFVLDRRLFHLSALMMKVDLFAFGGGFASLPIMLHEVVNVRGWMDQPTFMDGVALGNVTPGPIVITATFVGHRLAGLAGAVVATVSIFTPSLVMVLLTAPHLERLGRSAWFRRALRGVLATFVGLLLAVTVHFARGAPWTAPGAVLAGAAFVAFRLKVDILWVVLAGAAISMLVMRG